MKKKSRISNHDIIPMALYELGGVGKFIDVEDVFIRCYEISPERFGWRKYDFPNYKIIYKALVDYEERYPSHLLKTPDGLGRQLSAEGVDWIARKHEIFKKILESPEKTPPSRRPNQKILNEISQSKTFSDYTERGKQEFQRYEIADLLLCSPDSPPELWRERLETYRSTATRSKRFDLLRFLDHLLQEYPEWFGGH